MPPRRACLGPPDADDVPLRLPNIAEVLAITTTVSISNSIVTVSRSVSGLGAASEYDLAE
jgi:hypothetical protein